MKGGGEVEDENWLMELGCETGQDWEHTDEGVESAKIAAEIFRQRLVLEGDGSGQRLEDFVKELSLDAIAKAQRAALAQEAGVWHNGAQ